MNEKTVRIDCIQRVLCGVLANIFLAMLEITQAAIIPSGDYFPLYDAPQDPWEPKNLSVGTIGEGEFSVTAGSKVRVRRSGLLFNTRLALNPDTVATVNVLGEGSSLLTEGYIAIGEQGEATLKILEGGLATNRRAYLGYEPNSKGAVNVSGAGSTWRNFELLIGEQGNGTLSIQNGGYVTSNFGRLGNERSSTGSVLVNGSTSIWENTGDLLVGRVGVGELVIENGGHVSNKNGTISSGSSLTVDGLGSVWSNSENLVVDESGEATLNVTDHGVVTVAGGTKVGASRKIPIRESFNGPIIGYNTIPASVIKFDRGTLNTGGIWALPESLLGTGVINTANYVGDHDLTFDANDDSQNQLVFADLPGQNVTINFDTSIENNSSPLGVGVKASASLAIADGRFISSGDGFLGYESGAFGAATVEGKDSTWKIGNELFVGRYGKGQLDVSSGGVVDVPRVHLGFGDSSNGTATVSGPESTLRIPYLLVVSEHGDGVLRIENGASLTSNISLLGTHSNGEVYVSGKGSNWDVQSDTFFIGRGLNGLGAVYVEDGASLSSSYGHIGRFRNSVGIATISGAGSEWRLGRTLSVGNEGTGTLRILDGSKVKNGRTQIGNWSTASGEAIVSGQGSQLKGGSIQAGVRGKGSFLLEDAGVAISEYGTLGFHSGSTGDATVSGIGSIWEIAYELTVGDEGTGSLLIENGGLVAARRAVVIDVDGDGDSRLRMRSGGMLAVFGVNSDSLTDLLDRIEGTDAIEYWDDSQWEHISNATPDIDFSLQHITSGKLEGYTILTVGAVVPECSSIVLFGLALSQSVVMIRRRS